MAASMPSGGASERPVRQPHALRRPRPWPPPREPSEARRCGGATSRTRPSWRCPCETAKHARRRGRPAPATSGPPVAASRQTVLSPPPCTHAQRGRRQRSPCRRRCLVRALRQAATRQERPPGLRLATGLHANAHSARQLGHSARMAEAQLDGTKKTSVAKASPSRPGYSSGSPGRRCTARPSLSSHILHFHKRPSTVQPQRIEFS